MSSAAVPGSSFTEEIRELGERLRAAAEKCGRFSEESGHLSEENRALRARLAAVQEQLAAEKAKNLHLLVENRDLARRLAKATPPDLAYLSDTTTGDSGIGPRQTSGFSSTSEPAEQHEGVTMTQPLPATPTQTILPIGVLFPDAGLNYLKMLKEVKHIPAVENMVRKAEPILGFDLWKLCLEGQENLPVEKTERAALAYITGLAGLEKLRCEREEAVTSAQVMAGLGNGEYAALRAAGVFSFEDGLRLVRYRLQAITEAQETGVKQATAWVAGLDRSQLAAICASAAKKTGEVCQISAECFARGLSVAGTQKAVLAATKLAEQAGAWQAHVNVNAVHSPLMELAQEKLNAMLDDVLPRMNPPRTTVYMNCTAAPVRPGTDPKEVAKVLKKELVLPLLWETSIMNMIEEGVSEFYEVAHGEVLKGFMKRINRKAWRTMTSVVV